MIALLAGGLAAEGFEIHLGLVSQGGWPMVSLPHSVTVHNLGARRVRTAAFRLLRLVRTLKPDAILSGMAHLNFMALLLRPLYPRRTRLLVRQNATVSAVLADGTAPWHTDLLYRRFYSRADRIVCPTRAMAADLAAVVPMAAEKLAVLPNPIDFEAIQGALGGPSLWQGPGPHLLAVGRLSAEKGFDLLLESLAAIRRQFPAADLVVSGAGPERCRLEVQAKRLQLDRAVRFAGYCACPYRFYPGATLLVLPSRQEGMPNALLEGDAAGLPLVATPASEGIVDLLRGRSGAWLASEVSAEALTDAILTALANLGPGQRFAREALGHGAIQSYSRLIDSVCAAR